MTQEEKAKAYDDALERARAFELPEYKSIMESVFPELKESEDEKIRKSLIDGFTVMKESKNCGKTFSNHNIPVADILAWLEKQRESNPYSGVSFGYNGHTWGMCARDNGVEILIDSEFKAFISLEKSFIYPVYPQPILVPKTALEAIKEEKVEPKFKVGDWVVNNYNRGVCQVTEIRDDEYCLWPLDAEMQGYLRIIDVDDDYHLWTIKDAKDGDVLVYGDNPADHHIRIIMLFESMRTFISAFNHFHIFDDEFRINDCCDCGKTAHPATKEQRDLLFAKMKEVGYEWNGEKKELRKIEQKTIKSCAEYFNKNNELKMPELSEFQNKLADILMEREYTGSTETEEDMAKGRLEYELAAIKISEEILPLAQKRY